jgi:hypothetical protein
MYYNEEAIAQIDFVKRHYWKFSGASFYVTSHQKFCEFADCYWFLHF